VLSHSSFTAWSWGVLMLLGRFQYRVFGNQRKSCGVNGSKQSSNL
jgi:hypothetical protein